MFICFSIHITIFFRDYKIPVKILHVVVLPPSLLCPFLDATLLNPEPKVPTRTSIAFRLIECAKACFAFGYMCISAKEMHVLLTLSVLSCSSFRIQTIAELKPHMKHAFNMLVLR